MSFKCSIVITEYMTMNSLTNFNSGFSLSFLPKAILAAKYDYDIAKITVEFFPARMDASNPRVLAIYSNIMIKSRLKYEYSNVPIAFQTF